MHTLHTPESDITVFHTRNTDCWILYFYSCLWKLISMGIWDIPIPSYAVYLPIPILKIDFLFPFSGFPFAADFETLF